MPRGTPSCGAVTSAGRVGAAEGVTACCAGGLFAEGAAGRARSAPLASPMAVVSFALLTRAARLSKGGLVETCAGCVVPPGTTWTRVSELGGFIVRR